MQILELDCDPWREQHFTEFTYLSGVHIPADDVYAFNTYPRHQWIYNRFLIAKSQALECGLHDVAPHRYPVYYRSVTNLEGMAARGRVLAGEHDYLENCRRGDFWMTLLVGEQISTDFAVVKGETAWCRHTCGVPGVGGRFDYWVVEERTRPRLVKYCNEWLRGNLAGYTGMVNIETIGGRITDVHLRAADQWLDLYGKKWLDALGRLHERETWDLIDTERAESYSVVLFGSHSASYAYPQPSALAAYRTAVGISSIKFSALERRPLDARAMPTGGFHLAVINCFNLAEGLRVRDALARDLGLAG